MGSTIKKIALGCDHAGYALKEEIKHWLEAKGIEIKDFGTFSDASVDYPDFIHPLASAIENHEFPMGFIFCGSGNGVSMVANKHQGIRAALCWNTEIARLSRQHNDANILALPARYISVDQAREMADAFLQTEFEGGRHQNRVNKIPLQK